MNDEYTSIMAEADAAAVAPDVTEGMGSVKRFAELEMLRRNLEESLKQVKGKIESQRSIAETVMAESGMDRCKVAGLTVFFTEKFIVNKKPEKEGVTTQHICEALQLLGRNDMVKDGYAPSSLKAYVAELLEEYDEVPAPLADLIKVHKWAQLTTRR